MEPKYSKIFDKNIIKSLKEFCELNKIEDIDGFIKKCFETGFNIEKYGLLGKTFNEGEKHLIKEVIVEKIVEVPVDVIKEVEKIIEVPVDKIIEKIIEVPVDRIVEKEVYITDNIQVQDLSKKIENLKKEIDIKEDKIKELKNKKQVEDTKEIEKPNQKTEMLQKTIQNLNTEIRELKKKNEELEKKLLETPKQLGDIPAKFHGSSNLNNNLYK